MNEYAAGDYLVRAIAREANVRAAACVTTALVREAARRHRSTPVATAALGYGLTAVTLLGTLIKVQQRVGLKVAGDGPLGKLVAESDSYGHVRGYVSNPEVPWPLPVDAADMAEALGRTGALTVFKDLQMKEMYEGVVPIQTGELDSDLVYYLIRSEQVPSLVEIGVKLDERGELLAAGGVLLQLLPGQEATALSAFADRMDDLPPLEELLADGQSPEAVLGSLFGDVAYDVLERHPVVFRCSCSRERSLRALTLLTREDLELLLEEGEAIVDCHFCHERYAFGQDDLREILAGVR